jgi:hypothetical protein
VPWAAHVAPDGSTADAGVTDAARTPAQHPVTPASDEIAAGHDHSYMRFTSAAAAMAADSWHLLDALPAARAENPQVAGWIVAALTAKQPVLNLTFHVVATAAVASSDHVRVTLRGIRPTAEQPMTLNDGGDQNIRIHLTDLFDLATIGFDSGVQIRAYAHNSILADGAARTTVWPYPFMRAARLQLSPIDATDGNGTYEVHDAHLTP